MRGSSVDPAERVRSARQNARRAKKDSRQVILVTGSNGGTGRRVVRELLTASNAPIVRALTRTRQKLVEALDSVGVDAEKAVQEGRLEIAVADLFNLRSEFFEDVIGIASCTGVNTGPVDDPDRNKYFQGLQFYPPTILDDSPKNVEFVGIGNLLQAAQKHFDEQTAEEDLPVMTFSEKETAQWGALDDVVMGGVSKSSVAVESGALVFSGFVSTDNFGGFTSIRTLDFSQPMSVSDYDGFKVRVKGDGKSYKLIVRCERKWDGVGYCYTFPTTAGEWTEQKIPFSDFKPVFRAKTLPDGKPLDPKNIFAFQLMLSKFEYDGELNPNFTPGPFELRLDKFAVYKKGADLFTPKIVHVSSAGVTRVLRKDEFDIELQPPAVRMNDTLGRILEWKLAGEDIIRQSGLPYCIIRPCALTEKDPLGFGALSFEQGDTVMGQISREDIAPLIVSAFETERLVNVTTEVSWKRQEQGDLSPFEEQIADLQVDAEESRPFASFPYVPTAATDD